MTDECERLVFVRTSATLWRRGGGDNDDDGGDTTRRQPEAYATQRMSARIRRPIDISVISSSLITRIFSTSVSLHSGQWRSQTSFWIIDRPRDSGGDGATRSVAPLLPNSDGRPTDGRTLEDDLSRRWSRRSVAARSETGRLLQLQLL